VISTLIFDLDGTLADTEKLHCLAYQQALGEVGVDISEAEYNEHWIRLGMNIDEFIASRGLPVDPDLIRVRKAERFDHLARTVAEAMPGVPETLAELREHKRLVLATSSYRDAASTVIERLRLAHFFEYVATKENAARVKPAPDIHFHLLEALALSPGECLVVEDAEKGVRAATAAGMKCVAIPNPRTASHDFSLAEVKLGSFGELTPELIERLG